MDARPCAEAVATDGTDGGGGPSAGTVGQCRLTVHNPC